ncbi:hypothetical protein HPB48_021579 [Haemaphysalis longicornis]|uniref:GH18 domain-containing protein n=1 Tax=Haemaphysalis longicornis TaxID=44386 RepID=A0A9J6H0V2_HAELO|nr:hypothetical protein HPB48_021579 [Haemaphysalis longicornis]
MPSTKTTTIVPTTVSISLTPEVVTTSSVTSTTTTTTEEVFNFDVERSPSYNVVCYFNHTSYRRAKPMSFRTGHIPVPYCSHIIYASLGVNEDAELVPKDPVFDIEQGGFAKFAAIKKRHPQVSVMVAIGEDMGDSKAFLQLSKYKQDAVALARNAASWLLDNGYDGLVVQWKMPASRADDSSTIGPPYKARLQMIVAALRDSLGSKTEIFVTVPNDEELRQKYFDVPALSRHVNRFLAVSNWLLPLEGRTGSGARSKVTSLPDPINDVLHTRHTLVGASKAEIYRKFCFVLDIGARTYTLARPGNHDLHAAILGPGKPGPYTGLPGTMAYYEICNQTWATAVKGTFASYVAQDDQWVGYLDISNLERLLRMVLYKHRASCVGIWDVSLDDFRGVCGDPFPFTKEISAWKEKSIKFRRRASENNH